MHSKNSSTYYMILIALFLVPLMYFKKYIGPLPLSIEVIMIPLITIAAAKDLFQGKIRLNDFKIWPMLIFFGLFFVVSAISFIEAQSLKESVMELARYTSYVVLFTIVTKVKFTKDQYFDFAKSFLLAVIIVGAFGIIQYIADFSLNKAGLYALEEAKGRVDSTLINPNYYASFLNFVIPTLMLLAVVYFKSKTAQLVWFSLYGIYVANVILTYTRSAWVIMAGAFCLTVILMPKAFFKKVIQPQILLAFLALLTVIYFMPDVQSRTQSAVYAIEKLLPHGASENPGDGDPEQIDEIEEEEEEDATTNRAVVSRVTLWKTGWVMMKDNPVLGVGLGNYSVRYKEYVTKYPELYIGHDMYSVHNSYLKVGAETGFIGVAAFLFIYMALLIYNIKLYFNQDLLGRIMAVGLFVGSITYMLQNLSNNLIFIPQLNTIFWLVAGLVLAFLHHNKKDRSYYY